MKRVLLGFLAVLAVSTVCSAQTFYFPQIAIGGFDGGTWMTTIFLSNATANTVSGAVMFTRSDGTPLAANWMDGSGNPVASGDTIPFQLGPAESRKFMSVGDTPLTDGYATVKSNSNGVLGNAVFSEFDGAGNLIAEAGVPMGIPLGKQAIFVDTINGFATGVAIANPNIGSLHIHFELVNDAGQIILTQTRDVPPAQHIAFFLSELFPDAPPMVGRLQFYCVNPMVSVALRFDPGFTHFTTMPPIAIAP